MTDEAGASGQSGDPGASGQSGGSSEPGSTGTGATFTQEQVDAFLAEERRRAASKYGDYDEVKKKLADLEAAGQTELERAQTQAKDSDAKAAAAIGQRDRLLVRSAVTAAAARQGARDPDVVVALLADTISVDDKGELPDDVEKLVEKLLEDKPYLRNGSTPTGGSADGGAHGRTGGSQRTPSAQMDDVLRASRHGS